MIDAGTISVWSKFRSAIRTVDTAETGDLNANAKAIVGINPHTSHINVTRVNGITTVIICPGGGIISGQSAIINLWGQPKSKWQLSRLSVVINFPRVSTFAFVSGIPHRLILTKLSANATDEWKT